MTSPRRDFLGWLGGASLVGAVRFPPSTEHPAPIGETWDMSWTDRVNGKYKAVFDSPDVSDGAAVFRAEAWYDMYKEVYGVEKKDISAVVVLRHSAIPLVMNHDYWERYDVGKELKLKDSKGKKWTKRNPVSATPGATEAQSKYTLESFLAAGGVVLACNWAFNFVVANVRKRDQALDAAAARAKALEMKIPGVILQPNGIFAALRAQEAGCHYIIAS